VRSPGGGRTFRCNKAPRLAPAEPSTEEQSGQLAEPVPNAVDCISNDMGALGAVRWLICLWLVNREPPVAGQSASGPSPCAPHRYRFCKSLSGRGSRRHAVSLRKELTVSSEIDGRVIGVGADLGDGRARGRRWVAFSDESSVTWCGE